MYDSLIVLFSFVLLAHFGCLSWSECEKKLLYVAERIKNSAGGRDSGEPACIKVSNTKLYRNSFMLIDRSSPPVLTRTGVCTVRTGARH